MTQKHHNNQSEELDNESFVFEECVHCGRDMTNPQYILTDLDSGNYCCKDCAEIWNLNAVPCRDL